ncbi:hypothetical protein [Deinococcus sp.]|uniref:hypothetical protein n=1 Tax=Deinococcus sp. TaxID=47478 RepID=UPI003C7C40AD
MRPAYLTAARALQLGREAALLGDERTAVQEYQGALDLLRTLPPERTRDTLLAHAHLAMYQTLAPAQFNPTQSSPAHPLSLAGLPEAQEHLRLGISYARSTRDPLARAIAEECLSGLDVVM